MRKRFQASEQTSAEAASRSRRAVLATAAAGAAALVVAALPEDVEAATGDNFILGQANSATSETTLAASGLDNLGKALGVSTSTGHAIDAATTDATAGAAIQARGPGGGVQGQATTSGGSGVIGESGSSGQGVLGHATGTGVAGFGGTAIPSPVTAGTGVYGSGDTVGVQGQSPAVGVIGSGPIGVQGKATGGLGVEGVASNLSSPTTGVNHAGVVGVVGNPANIPSDIALTGVYGFAGGNVNGNFVPVGVWGDSNVIGVGGAGATGVLGYGGWGVNGYAADATSIGVVAQGAAGSRALRVEGRAEFTRSGRATISAGSAKKTVTLAGCTSSTLVFAVLGASRSGRWVRAVVPSAGSFTIYLNTTVGSNTPVVWIAFTNPSNHGG